VTRKGTVDGPDFTIGNPPGRRKSQIDSVLNTIYPLRYPRNTAQPDPGGSRLTCGTPARPIPGRSQRGWPPLASAANDETREHVRGLPVAIRVTDRPCSVCFSPLSPRRFSHAAAAASLAQPECGIAVNVGTMRISVELRTESVADSNWLPVQPGRRAILSGGRLVPASQHPGDLCQLR